MSPYVTLLKRDSTMVLVGVLTGLEPPITGASLILGRKSIAGSAIGGMAETQELVDRLAKAAPLERLGTPEDIAAAVSFLAGPDGAWINGQTLRANGGII